MIKIGDFSMISQVSVKTLRYYDEMGLLKPVEVDRFSGYRYYSLEQLPRLYRILALKDLGFTLEEIGRLLAKPVTNEELRGMLRQKQEELRRLVKSEQERLGRVEARLRQLEQENEPMNTSEVVIKKIDPVLVASVRDIIPSYSEQGPLWAKLGMFLGQKGITPKGACFTLYHSEEPEIDAEVCEPLPKPVQADGPVKVYELPPVEHAASLVYTGPFTGLSEAYSTLFQWIQSRGYRICGPCREVYLKPPAVDGDQNDPEAITELQFPITRSLLDR